MKSKRPLTDTRQPAARLLTLYSSGLLVVLLLLVNRLPAQVRVDAADERVTGELRRVESLLVDRQWNEAIEAIQRLNSSDGNRLYRLDEWRYIPVRQYNQALLGQLPGEALARYRERIDPAAEQDYLSGRLERIVRLTYASSYTDDALLALGEAALAEGDAARAYRLWEQILAPPPPKTAEGQTTTAWPGCPDSNLDPAAVRARLILASILGGHPDRARAELARFRELHPQARGPFAGREDADYAEVLQNLLDEPIVQNVEQSKNFQGSDSAVAWLTFAGNPARNRTASRAVDASRIAWRRPLEPLRLPAPFRGYEHEPHRKDLRLAYHPALDQAGQLFLTGENGILGLDARSGEPLWGSDGMIYRESETSWKGEESWEGEAPAEPNRHDPDGSPDGSPSLSGSPSLGLSTLPEGTLGIPQFTTTLRDDRLYARLGTPLTNRASSDITQAIQVEAIDRDALVCLDLKAEGRLVWQIQPDGKDWSFDGTPIVDGKNAYVAMRRGGIRPESHVACFDTTRGTMRWRQFVCSAPTRSTAGRTPGSQPECTHNLLTLQFDTLYFNTNLGAVASLETETGEIRWLTLYPQTVSNDRPIPPPYTARILCPCVYDRGTLYVAPSDSASIFALDAFSGELLWSTGSKTPDVVHLLGTLGDRLLASGDHLYWIATTGPQQGQIVRRFPDGEPLPARGRGILAEGRIYWPTVEQLFIFEGDQLAKTIDLRSLGLTGGNLTIIGTRLLITTDREVTALE